jgi:tetratricopeptide (TPR) repeat protein
MNTQRPSPPCLPCRLRRFGACLALTALCVASLAWARAARAGGDETQPAAQPVANRDPDLSKRHFEDGEVMREERKWGPAADAYWKAIEADLLNYRAHVRYQEAARRCGDAKKDIVSDYDGMLSEHRGLVAMQLHRDRLRPVDERLPLLQDLAKDHPKDADVQLELGRALLAQDKAKEAVSALEKALALVRGDRPDVLIMLAEAEHAAGQTDDAVKRLDARVKADPEDFDARLVLARMQLDDGAFEPAAANAATVLEQRPTFLAAFLVKSEALVGLGKDKEALEAVRAAYRAAKDDDDVVIALADLTARQETEAAYKQAIGYYDQVLARHADSWRAIYGKAWAFERLANWGKAEELYRQVVTLRPTSAHAVNSVGYCLFKQGRISEAQVQFKRAIDMDPSFVTAMNNLGGTFDAQAKYTDAIRIYEKVLRMKGQAKNLRALINCAFDYEASGAFARALKLLQQAHDILPKDANIVVWIGDNYYFQARYHDAEKWYKQAISMDEKSFFAWRGLGLSLAQRKKWEDAADALEKASKLKPKDLDLIVILGDLYYDQLHDLEKALAKYQEFVQKGGNDPDVNDAILEIKKKLAK